MSDTLKTIGPVDGRIYVERQLATAAGIEHALDSAQRAQFAWNSVPLPIRCEILGDAVDADTVFLNRYDHLDPALPWTGAENSGRGYTLSSVSFAQLTRPKSYHFRTAT
jgi:acyl-CoA reductase-like NAD-dependent aldehyde dehydrogenase